MDSPKIKGNSFEDIIPSSNRDRLYQKNRNYTHSILTQGIGNVNIGNISSTNEFANIN